MCGSCHMLKTAVKGLHHHPGRYHGETKIGSIRFGLNDIAIALLAKSTNSGEKFVNHFATYVHIMETACYIILTCLTYVCCGQGVPAVPRPSPAGGPSCGQAPAGEAAAGGLHPGGHHLWGLLCR